MIQRIALIWYADDVDETRREAVRAQVRERLAVAGGPAVEVGRQVDAEAGFQLSIVLRFADLAAAQAHSGGAAWVGMWEEVLRPVMGGAKIYDFAVDGHDV